MIDQSTATESADYVRFDDSAGSYAVTGFEEAAAILRAPGWSSNPRLNPAVSAGIRELPPSVLLFLDPPDHTRLRRLVSPAFTPRVLNQLRPRIAEIVTAALDSTDAEQIDLVSDYAYIVPLAVIAEFLDVGTYGAEVFREYTPALARLLEIDPTPTELSAGADASVEIMMFLSPVIAERRQHPGDDFISLLLQQDDITVDEVLSTCILLLAAGHETTANLIANGADAILRNPDQRDHLLHDPARAVEELLRLHGPVKYIARTATESHQIGGYEIPAGATAFIQLHAANADPRRFSDPQRLNLSRNPLQHLAFGGGAHFCLGAALTRMEGAEALPALFERYPGMELATDAPAWRDSTTFHGLTELPLRLGEAHL